VAVEARLAAAEQLNRRFADYVAGASPLRRNEIEQLGFRLAKALGHREVHPVDAEGRRYEPDVDLEKYAAEKGQLDRLLASETPWENYYDEFYRFGDARKMR